MMAIRGWLALPIAMMLMFAVTGCGGSSSERDQLLSKVSSELPTKGTGSLPLSGDPELASCMSEHAHNLSTPQLRVLANAGATGSGSGPNPAAVQPTYQLVGTCIQQGRGVAALRARISQGVSTSPATSSLPPALSSCLQTKLNAIPDSQLAGIFFRSEHNPTLVRPLAAQLGRQTAQRCFYEPAVVAALRVRFVAPFRQRLGSLSPALRTCVLGKAERVSDSQIRRMALRPTRAAVYGEQLGRTWAEACLASGKSP